MKQFHNYAEWIEKAEHDLEAARELFNISKTYDVVCFHCQQAVEKYVKAFLVAHTIRFEKVHDLWVLAQKAMTIEPNVRLFKEKLKTLDAHYITARYPGEEIKYSREEAKEALAFAEEIINFLKERI